MFSTSCVYRYQLSTEKNPDESVQLSRSSFTKPYFWPLYQVPKNPENNHLHRKWLIVFSYLLNDPFDNYGHLGSGSGSGELEYQHVKPQVQKVQLITTSAYLIFHVGFWRRDAELNKTYLSLFNFVRSTITGCFLTKYETIDQLRIFHCAPENNPNSIVIICVLLVRRQERSDRKDYWLKSPRTTEWVSCLPHYNFDSYIFYKPFSIFISVQKSALYLLLFIHYNTLFDLPQFLDDFDIMEINICSGCWVDDLHNGVDTQRWKDVRILRNYLKITPETYQIYILVPATNHVHIVSF